MEKVLVTTPIHLQSPFSLSLCDPLFHLAEAGKGRPNPVLSSLSRRIAERTARPHCLPQSLFHVDVIFSWAECPWEAPHASLFSEAGNADVASMPLLPLLLERTQTFAVMGQHSQLLLASGPSPWYARYQSAPSVVPGPAESSPVRRLVRNADSQVPTLTQ